MWNKDPPCFPLICRFSAVFPGCPLFFLKSFLLGTRQICKMWPSIITDTWIMTSWHLNTSGWRWCNKDFIGKPCTLYLCLRSPWPGYQVWGGCQSEEWLPPCSCAAHSDAERMWRMHRTGREINTETMKQQSHRMPRLNFFHLEYELRRFSFPQPLWYLWGVVRPRRYLPDELAAWDDLHSLGVGRRHLLRLLVHAALLEGASQRLAWGSTRSRRDAVSRSYLFTALLLLRVPFVRFFVAIKCGSIHRVQAFSPLAIDRT